MTPSVGDDLFGLGRSAHTEVGRSWRGRVAPRDTTKPRSHRTQERGYVVSCHRAIQMKLSWRAQGNGIHWLKSQKPRGVGW